MHLCLVNSLFGRSDAQFAPFFVFLANSLNSLQLLQFQAITLTFFAVLESAQSRIQITGVRSNGDNWRSLVNRLKAAMAIARILFPLPLPEPFDYAVPDGMDVVAGSYVRAPLGKTMRTGMVWEMAETDPADDRDLKSIDSVYPTPPMTSAMRAFVDFAARYTVASPGAVLAMSLRSRGGLSPPPTETVYALTGTPPDRLTPAREKLIIAAEAHGPASAAALADTAGVSASVVKGMVKAGAMQARDIELDPPFPAPDPSKSGKSLTDEQSHAAAQLTAAMQSERFSPFLLDGVTGSGKPKSISKRSPRR